MAVDSIWRQELGKGPIVAIAVHDGHEVRDDVAALLALDETDRLREEDPFTSEWTSLAPTRIVCTRSRFEVDLNRARQRAVYRRPDDAWGLNLWHGGTATPDLVERSLAEYDRFYEGMYNVLQAVEREHGRFVVYDLHTYNHRRNGPDAAAADPHANPQVNIGTGTLNKSRWGGIVDRFMADLRAYDFPGGSLDVRENVKFRGGHFSSWVHNKFPATGCTLAIEFKKFFMDEWTGKPDRDLVEAIGDALRSTVPGVLEGLQRIE